MLGSAWALPKQDQTRQRSSSLNRAKLNHQPILKQFNDSIQAWVELLPTPTCACFSLFVFPFHSFITENESQFFESPYGPNWRKNIHAIVISNLFWVVLVVSIFYEHTLCTQKPNCIPFAWIVHVAQLEEENWAWSLNFFLALCWGRGRQCGRSHNNMWWRRTCV